MVLFFGQVFLDICVFFMLKYFFIYGIVKYFEFKKFLAPCRILKLFVIFAIFEILDK